MTDDPKQTVVDTTNATAQPVAEVESARTEQSLEELLAAYDQETAKPPTPSPSEPKTEQTPSPVFDPRYDEISARFNKEDLEKAVDAVRGDTGAPKGLVRGWLNGLADDNPGLQRIWNQRNQNPQALARALTAAGREFQKEWSRRPDPESTADRAAVSHAVRGASTPVPPAEPPPNLGAMTDAELREYTRKNFGF